MRNYIILNNKSSNDINGLIIQELAPISKPQQRTQVETIDGRDGDIVTPLGYAAYNKKIKIGLYGNFDINEIIAYFATQGTAIFSNEPDKYYNYQILDQIDYERLVRFRVATVTMHVQPFKYSATEGTLTIDASDTVSGEGSDIALDNTAEAPFNVLRHKGNAIQDGTPTPDNPIDVKVLTGEQTIKITGKNLFNPHDMVKGRTDNGVIGYANGTSVLEATDTSVTFTTTANYRGVVSGLMSVKPSQTYTFTATVSTTTSRYIDAYDIDGNWIQRITGITGVNATFTTPDNCYGIRVSLQLNNAGTCTITRPQFELGSQATDYEEFKGQSYVIPFGDTYLAAIGDYADEPVKVGDKWYIRRKIGKVVLDGSESQWNLSSGSGRYSFWRLSSTFSNMLLQSHVKKCDRFTYSPFAFLTAPIPSLCENSIPTNPMVLFNTDGSQGTTVDAWKTWLAAHPTTVYYILATPTDEEITDQDLIDALDDFYEQAHAYKSHTHITATAEDGNAPAVLAVEVNQDNETTVTNAGNTTSRPIITIYGQGNIDMYINDVQVLDIALGDEQYITIDSVAMEAYKDTTENLKNRLVTGDYNKLALNAGDNKIYFTGNVTKYEISKYSRWL